MTTVFPNVEPSGIVHHVTSRRCPPAESNTVETKLMHRNGDEIIWLAGCWFGGEEDYGQIGCCCHCLSINWVTVNGETKQGRSSPKFLHVTTAYHQACQGCKEKYYRVVSIEKQILDLQREIATIDASTKDQKPIIK